MTPLPVEIWSDVACPWCYIGKRRWERALLESGEAADVDTTWRSFQLDPGRPKGARDDHETSLARKLGISLEQVRAMDARVAALAAAEGLDYHFERYVTVNTMDAHRLAHLARRYGLGAEMHERLFRGQFVEGEVLDDPDTLARLGEEVGVPAGEARAMLASDRYLDAVESEIRMGQALGVTGVPFFVLDRRLAVSGAQPTEVFVEVLRRAREEAA